MRSLVFIAVLLAVANLALPSAYAADACADEVRQLCSDVKVGSGGIHACLRQNQGKLSEACRTQLITDDLRGRKLVQDFGAACGRDAEQFCAGLLPGGGRILQCLSEHETELATGCRSEVSRIAEANDRVAAVKRACKADAERLCVGVPSEVGPLLDCLQANETKLSAECNAAEVRHAIGAAALVDTIAEMTREDRVKEALEILQGVDSVAFSRSQILFQFDNFQDLGGKANADRFLFNPQFVFGGRNEFAVQLKAPVVMLFPNAAGVPAQTGLGDITTAFAWGFYLHGQIGQYLSLGLQWPTAPERALGAAWAIQPTYAIALGLARWLSLTTQLTWVRSFANNGYPDVNLLIPEPIFVVNLPGRSFLALDTKLGIDLDHGTFVPVMKGVAGLFLDRQKSVSISGWYQASLSSEAVADSFKWGVGVGMAYFFDW